MLRFLLVGTGFGAQHAGWLTESGARLAVVGYHRDRARAQELAARCGAAAVTDDPLAVIAAGSVDAVAVVSPPGAREEVCSAALAAGLLVVCDKPLAVDLPTARRLADLAAKSSGRAAVTFQWRTHPALRRLREWCRSGGSGLLHLDLSFHHDFLAGPGTAWPWRHSAAIAGAGALADQGVHLLDLLRWLAPGSWRVTTARQAVVFPERETPSGPVRAQTDDVAEVWLAEVGSGTTARVHVSRVSRGYRGIRVLAQATNGVGIVELSPEDASGHALLCGAGEPEAWDFGPTTLNPYPSIIDGAETGAVVAGFGDGCAAQELVEAALAAYPRTGAR